MEHTSPVPTGTDLCLFILLDGARPDVLAQLRASGQLPNIDRYLGGTHEDLTGTTCLPSSTSLAYLPMLTGQYPGSANVPGTRWVDKTVFGRNGWFHSGHRSYVGPGLVSFDRDLKDEMETIFELCPGSLAFRSEIRRGLEPGQNRSWGFLAPLLALGHYARDSGMADRLAIRDLRQELLRFRGENPRFVFLPLTNVDTRSHGYGPMSRQVANAYRNIDEGIGAIVQAIQSRGLWPRTLMMLSSDHGHTETKSHLDLSALVERVNYRVFEYPMLYRRNCTAAVMISGNALAHIYLASEQGWNGPLFKEQMEKEHAMLLARLRTEEAIDWIAYRYDSEQVALLNEKGTSLLGMEDGAYTYVTDGADPLRLELDQRVIFPNQALRHTVDGPFPDALEQIWHLFRSTRTGDIVVTAKPGYDLRARYEWPEHHSSHGALCRDQMLVPILANQSVDEAAPIRTADLFPTMAYFLGVQPGKPHYGRNLIG
jgi:hypothetical protein